MLDNSITISTDISGTPTDEIFSRDESYLNRSVFTGPNHTLADKETLSFYRTRARVSGNFRGMAKTAAKFTFMTDVDGVDSTTSLQAPVIGEVSFSIPVGTSAANKSLIRERIVAFLNNEAVASKLIDYQNV